ncbi:RNA-binding domain-containing protein [Endothiovibrio diazotrophicus]
MDLAQLLEIVARGEDSHHQFKEDYRNADGLAAEMAAFANGAGGTLLIGVSDEGEITGLSAEDVGRLNNLISNAASQHVRPPLHPQTSNVMTERGVVIAARIPTGLNRPYMDNQGRIWVKSGADKRHVTAREEMQRLFQQAGLIYADELPVEGATAGDLDRVLVNALIHRDYFINAPVRVLLFADRIEISSPGHLPNHLTTEQIRHGLSNIRNPSLMSHATHLLPYRGLGSGIPRVLRAYPAVRLVDDREGNQFTAIIERPADPHGGG